MSFVRVKEGVFELVDTYYSYKDGKETLMYMNHRNHNFGVEIDGKEVIKESNDLIELVDAFTIVSHTGGVSVLPNCAKSVEILNTITGDVYGSIYVMEDGLPVLRPVIKLVEGEFELV